MSWTVPRNIKELRGFLGLVQYLRNFVVGLAESTAVLSKLTTKATTRIDETNWGPAEQTAFEKIKNTMVNLPCLRPIDHASSVPVWVMTDASQVGLGAVLMQGEDYKTAITAAYYSRQFIPAEKNYGVHEQEMLAVVEALKHWRMDLVGGKFTVLTDHESLKYFWTQPSMSRRQSRWLESMADYDFTIVYIQGEDNVRSPTTPPHRHCVPLA